MSTMALVAVMTVHAAEEKASVSRVYNDTVAPADQVAYEAAVKAYNKCLGDHGFKFTWTAWGHETGNTYLYSYVAGPYTWANFDEMATAAKPCDDTWRNQANPHLKGEASAFLVQMPELSHVASESDAKPALISVAFFTIKPGREEQFTDGVKKIAEAAEKSNWSANFQMSRVRGGGKDFPDFVLVGQYKTWADYGAGPNPSTWKMVESVLGKDDTDALRKSINDAIQEVHSHVDLYSAELTYTAPK
jgi:hypothetical protein